MGGASHRQVGDWLIGEAIGRGGMGVVYEAQHRKMAGSFAIKEIRPELTSDPKARAYFVREADSAVRLRHPNIVRTLEKVEIGDRLLLAMERLRGDTLETRLDRGEAWRAQAAAEIVGQAAAGLGHAHGHGIVHRDVKPGNILITPEGTVKVLDFGVSRVLGEASLQSVRSGPPGTPAYMPPEVLMGGGATPASDVFSLGLVYFRMVTGRLPHEVPADRSPWVVVSALVKAYARDLPRMSTFRPDVPRPYDLLVARLLSADPLQRPKNGDQVATALGAAGGSAPAVTALGVGGVHQLAPPMARPPWDPALEDDRLPPVREVRGQGNYARQPSPEGTRLGVGAVDSHRGAAPVVGAVFRGQEPESGRWPEPAPAPTIEPDDRRRQVLVWSLAALVVVLSLVVVSLIGRGGSPSAPRVPPTEGWIEVKSQPPGASIELEYEGRAMVGTTPQTFRGLKTSRGIVPATVWIRAEGYKARMFTVPVVPGLEQHVDARLEPEP